MKNSLKLLGLLLLFSLFSNACKKDDCPEPSTQNTELVKKLFGYFGAGDIQNFLNGCASDCVFELTGNQILNPGADVRRNAGFNEFLGDLSQKGQPTSIQPLEFFESGDAVTVNGKVEFKDLATGKTCKANFIQLWKFKNGKATLLKEDHDNRVCN